MDLLAWYVRLAQQPGWKEYVWHRVNELAKVPMYADLPAQLVAAMKERNENDRAKANDHAQEAATGQGAAH